MNSSKPFASFRQDPKDIPPLLRYGVMNQEIYYYYRHLNYVLQKEGLLEEDSACIYPGIGSDMSTVPTLFGARKIIGFDAAGLYGGFINNPVKWYDLSHLNGLKRGLLDYKINEAITIIKNKCIGRGYDTKKNRGGYKTIDFNNGDNSRLLLIELLSLGIPLEKIQFEEIRDNYTKCLHIFFIDNIYPDIYIYQANVLDERYKDDIESIVKQHNPKYYIQKTGEQICVEDSIPLEYMKKNIDTKILALGCATEGVKIIDPKLGRESFTRTSELGRNYISEFSQLIARNLLLGDTGIRLGDNHRYRRELDLYTRKK